MKASLYWILTLVLVLSVIPLQATEQVSTEQPEPQISLEDEALISCNSPAVSLQPSVGWTSSEGFYWGFCAHDCSRCFTNQDCDLFACTAVPAC